MECSNVVFESLNSGLTPFIYELKSLVITVIKTINDMNFFLLVSDNLFTYLESIAFLNIFTIETQLNQQEIPIKLFKQN